MTPSCYSGGMQRFEGEPPIAAVLPQLCGERSLFISRFELLYSQLSKQVWLGSRELLACYMSGALTEGMTCYHKPSLHLEMLLFHFR